MLESEETPETTTEGAAPAEAPDSGATDSGATDAGDAAPAPAKKATARKSAAKKTTAKKATARKSPAKKVAAPEGEKPQAPKAAAKPKKKAAAKPVGDDGDTPAEAPQETATAEAAPAAPEMLFQVPEKKAPARKRATKKAAAEAPQAPETDESQDARPADKTDDAPGKKADQESDRKPGKSKGDDKSDKTDKSDATDQSDASDDDTSDDEQSDSGEGSARRRPRRRGGRRRRGRGGSDNNDNNESGDADDNGDAGDSDSDNDDDGESGEGTSRRRRSRQRKPRNPEDEIASVSGSTRLEAKKQRRREGREAGRRRAPIVSEAEFLARRESVERTMVIRQRDDLTQIGVIEDKVLVEHYVARKSQTSLIGNVYLGRVQNVLPSMEAAFIDIGKGRNAVLYAGEVNWSALGHQDGQPRKIESVLSSGQTILVQVTKDPVGHKGARLSGQVSLPGRFLVYVPDGNTSGISRKLPDTERSRLKTLLKQIVPDSAGVIVRTAAEGASEDELTRDVERLTARWQDIEEKVKKGKGPELLYGEPDLTLKVVRDLFTEDFAKLVVQGDDAWDLVQGYVAHVAPDLEERLERFEPGADGKDLFASYRVDEQIAKGLDRKVWLPSGGSLIIDRTEAMTVVDVNTGKFTGSGGNLEETVTKNNLEAAEEMVRQLRLRDIGGIIVIDFIDMVLESNRELVLRRLVECLGRDRTRHQVAEVTSLGLVQMTRKRIGTGLVEAFSEECSHCKGRGLVLHDHPIDSDSGSGDDDSRGRRGRGGRGRGRSGGDSGTGGGNNGGNNGGGRPAQPAKPPSPADLAGSRPKPSEDEQDDEVASAQAEPESPTPVEPEPAAEPESPTEPEPPAGPTVVTTTRRRRTARRPAGPPAGATEPTPEAAVPDTGSDEVLESTSAVDDPEVADPEASAVTGSEDSETPAESAAESSDDAEAPVLHVPVKRKGTKKR